MDGRLDKLDREAIQRGAPEKKPLPTSHASELSPTVLADDHLLDISYCQDFVLPLWFKANYKSHIGKDTTTRLQAHPFQTARHSNHIATATLPTELQ